MPNIFEESPVYVDIQTLRDSTTNPDLQNDETVTDSQLSILITKAEVIIDYVIQDFWEPNEENQETIFPIKTDDWKLNTEIPKKIKMATILLVESMYIWGVLDWMAYEGWFSGKVKSETSRGHTISYYNSSGDLVDYNQFLNEEIMMYLKPYTLNLWAQWYIT